MDFLCLDLITFEQRVIIIFLSYVFGACKGPALLMTLLIKLIRRRSRGHIAELRCALAPRGTSTETARPRPRLECHGAVLILAGCTQISTSVRLLVIKRMWYSLRTILFFPDTECIYHWNMFKYIYFNEEYYGSEGIRQIRRPLDSVGAC
jgi:hypothetical protein